MQGIGIKGMGYYVPENVFTNFDFEKIIDTSDEWIRTRTGIIERRFASKDQATSDLATEASLKAIKNAKINKEDVDMIILATTTADYIAQGAACIVQNKLGLKKIPCFDLNAACTGFIYGLEVAYSLVKSGLYKNILVIGAETLSRIVDMQNRNKVPAGGSKKPNNEETIKNRENFVIMKGQDVFKFAVSTLPKVTSDALEKAKLKVNDLSMVFPHQANLRIIESAAKRMKFPLEKFYMNLSRYGNTSSASVGIALGEAIEKGLVKKGDNIALTGFGGGLTYGSTIIKWAY